MNDRTNGSSVILGEPVHIVESASVVGTKEGRGPLGTYFDLVGEDDLFGAKNWEEAESEMQKNAACLAMKKAKLRPEDITFLFAGDLLGQSIASSFGLSGYQIPMFGVYGACSTCGESLALGTLMVSGGFAKRALCVTSSHFASAEKEFRFPLEYGSQRPLSASWTVTGSGAFILSKETAGVARIAGVTVGRIVDFGIKDSMNMGACMAPAAATTIGNHFREWNRTPKDYDCIITGDLGKTGRDLLLHLLRKEGYDLSDCHMDCGIEMYDLEKQDVHAGGSGCGCCASILSAYILRKLSVWREWNRVLFVPTGALLSKVSFQEGRTIPGIAHAIVLERNC